MTRLRVIRRAALLALCVGLVACNHQTTGAQPVAPKSLFGGIPADATRVSPETFAPTDRPTWFFISSALCRSAMCNPSGWTIHLAPGHRAGRSLFAAPPEPMPERWFLQDNRLCLAGASHTECLEFWSQGGTVLARNETDGVFHVTTADGS